MTTYSRSLLNKMRLPCARTTLRKAVGRCMVEMPMQFYPEGGLVSLNIKNALTDIEAA